MDAALSPGSLKRFARRLGFVRPAYLWVKGAALHVRFLQEYARFKGLLAGAEPRLEMPWSDRWPCMWERTASMGFEPHYLFHPAWAARVLARIRPERHVDISSALPFVTMLSAFIPVDYYEYRPTELNLSGLTSNHADLLAMPFAEGSIRSLSCMHTLDHVGLGRYGDPMDPDGDLKAIRELKRVLAPGGNLLIVVPMGRPRIRFNSDRVYSYRMIVDAFADLELREFAMIVHQGTGGRLISNATEADAASDDAGCGCFWFAKPEK